MKPKELKPDGRYWCWWKSRWLWYKGVALNARDFEFEDAGGLLVVLNRGQVENLRLQCEPCKPL